MNETFDEFDRLCARLSPRFCPLNSEKMVYPRYRASIPFRIKVFSSKRIPFRHLSFSSDNDKDLATHRHLVVNLPNVITVGRIFTTPYISYLVSIGSYDSAIGCT